MSNRTSWTRLWCSHRSQELDGGLESRMADPLWLLARQWQFGGFEGDNAASPAKVHIESEVRDVTELTGNSRSAPKTALGNLELLEAVVESGEPENGPANLHISAKAGLQFLRLIGDKYRAQLLGILQKEFPLPAPSLTREPEARSTRVLSHLARGSFDARAFREQKGMLEKLARAIEMDPRHITAAFKKWAEYYDGRFVTAPKSKLWRQQRQEYEFGLNAVAKETKIGLRSRDYAGGHLDWNDFDITSAKGNRAKSGRIHSNWMLPTPVAYSGMPAERFWDFEDGEVFFGGLNAEKTDLAQLVLTEFATVYSNDWFMLPLPTKTGTLSRIDKIVVTDVFGEKTVIKPSAANDGTKRPWRFFELKGDPSASQGLSPWLYLPRSVVGGEESQPVEEVVFTRDEMANLAWGIETKIEGPDGNVIRRDQEWAKKRDQLLSYIGADEQDHQSNSDDPPWIYRLLSVAPPYWVPFLPEVINNVAQPNLVRARMREWDLLGDEKDNLAGAQGMLMVPDQPLSIHEEEIQEGGIKVTRHYQTARSPDGKLLLWSSIKKLPASGAITSGRETDKIERKKP